MRAHVWSVTPLGEPEHWEHSLKAVVRVVLTSRFAMWMAWGPELTFFCNDAYLPTVGMKRDWVLGARSDAVWAEIWPDIGPRIEHVFSSGEATWDEALLLYLERSGFSEETYHTFSYSPLADDEGRTCGMLCVVAEVTERVIGERQLSVLRDLGARLAAASTRANVMASLEACLAAEPRDVPFALAYLADEDGRTCSLAAVHRARRDAPRVARAAWFGVPEGSCPPQIPDAGAALIDVAEGDVGATPLDHWQLAPRQALVAPIASSESGAPVGYLVAGLNPHRAFDAEYRGFIELIIGQVAAAIARADEFERERARAEALAEIDLAKTAFFSNVSHEFRTPLTLMLGPLEDVIAQPDETSVADVRNSIEVAHRNGLRLMRLVNALLDFSRIEAGRVVADFEATDLAAYTADLASTFRSATDRAGLSLVVEADPASISAHVDPGMWETIVLNLLSNAFKFTFAGGIAVDLRTVDGQARLTVRDTGTGIPDHELPKLFERFHRVEGAKGRSIEGSGIGLALVRELARLHGGDVTVESSVGAGSAFTVAIPLGRPQMRSETMRRRRAGGERNASFVEEALRWLPDEAEAGAPLTDAPVGIAPGRLDHSRVLVADDNRDMREYVRRLLTARGCVVEAVPDGRAALAAIRRERPDLLLSDVMMPGLDGFGLLREIRAEPGLQSLPVVLLSARAGEEAQIEGLAAGADDYLVKPFSARELLARVDSTLRMARLRDEAAEALRRRTAQFETLLNEAPLGVYLVDADMRIREVNPTALPVFGEIPDLIGRSFEDVVRILWRADYADELIGTFRSTLATGEAYVTSERIEDRLDRGRTEYYAWQISRIVLPDGRYGVVCYFRDVSAEVLARQAIVRSEEALRELNATLEQRVAREVAERAKAEGALHQAQKMETIGQLTGGIAHDFNNLLTPIMGSLDLLRRKVEGNARAERLIDIALQSAERARILIQRLLAFSRRQNLEAVPVDVDRLVNGMRDLATHTLGRSIRLVVEIPGGLPKVMADANQLELAILNLCVNARDAMPGGGTLAIAAEEQSSIGGDVELAPGDYVRISVVDTGSGMDEATLARAVEPFFSTKEVGKGTGLGLSMVHGFASQSGGAFQLSSRLGEGARADLWLPVTHEAAALHAIDDRLQSAAAACSASVLLVDDEELVRSGTAEMLRDLGYRVIEAGSAASALDLVRDGVLPDILITDHAMPNMTGVRLTEELRILIPGIPTLMITGYADLSDSVAHDIPILSKPFRQAELQSRVVDLLHPKP